MCTYITHHSGSVLKKGMNKIIMKDAKWLWGTHVGCASQGGFRGFFWCWSPRRLLLLLQEVVVVTRIIKPIHKECGHPSGFGWFTRIMANKFLFCYGVWWRNKLKKKKKSFLPIFYMPSTSKEKKNYWSGTPIWGIEYFTMDSNNHKNNNPMSHCMYTYMGFPLLALNTWIG